MSSDVSVPANSPPRLSDNSKSSAHQDLNKVFAHPAGLRTARFLTRSLIRASQSSSSEGQAADGIFSSVSLPFFDSSPEVESLLKEILAFSEPEMVSGSEGSDTISSGQNGIEDISLEAASATSSMIAAQAQHSFTNSPFAPQSSSTNSLTNFDLSHGSASSSGSHNTQPPASQGFSILEGAATFRSLNSPLHGTESPYHVESPSGRSTTVTPHNMSRQASGRPTNIASLPNPEVDPLRLDQASPYNAQFPNRQASASAQPRFADGSISSKPQARPAPQQIQPYGRGSASMQARAQSNTMPQIKNFLPVNKAPNNDSMAGKHEGTLAVINRASPGFSQYSHISNTYQQPHTHTLISPHPGPHHPSFKPLNDTTVALGNRKKRKAKTDGAIRVKRSKTDKPAAKLKKVLKEKEEKPTPACQKISGDLWLRIIEFCPPSFLKKVRLLSKSFKDLIDKYDSVYVNQRMENFGADIPVANLMGLTERQYTDLLGGKGCLEPGCPDKKASRTHWSWAKRWCTDCWKKKIEREDRILKQRQHDFPNRLVLTKLLECIPIGMHDSFMKAHDYIENLESRPSSAPRIYKYYLTEEVDQIIKEYNSFKPAPFKEDPTKSAAENATARAEHQQLEADAVVKQTNFLDERKEKNAEHMQRVLKIEGAIRAKRQGDALPYNENRKARRELFIKRAAEDMPDIPEEFVVETKAFKAATRIFRDPGTERGWKTLQPKIQKEWDDGAEKRQAATATPEVMEVEEIDDASGIDQQRERGSHQETIHMQDIRPQPHRQNQVAGFNLQRMDRQSEARRFMNERANNMIVSGGMFGSVYDFGGSSSMNNTGSTVQGLQSVYSIGGPTNATYFQGNMQFRSQQMLHSQLSGYQSLQGSFMTPQLFNSNANNMFRTVPTLNQPGDRKITVSSLLAPGPPPGSAPNFHGFQ